MKYHEKLNLKSPIYKYSNVNTSRTPSKSPIKPTINPSDLFQKVCCPNCKYAFKIIKQEIMKENPLQVATPTKKRNKIKEIKQIQTQTDNILTLSNFNSPMHISKSQTKLTSTQNYSVTQKMKDYQNNKLNKVVQQQSLQNKHLRESEFKFKPLSVSPDNKINKSKSLLKTLDVKNYKIRSSESIEVNQSFKQNSFIESKSPKQGHLNINLNDSINQRQNLGAMDLFSPRKLSEKFQEPLIKLIGNESLQSEENMNIFKKRNNSKPEISAHNNQINLMRKGSTSYVQREQRNRTSDKSCYRCENNDLETFIRQMVVKDLQRQNVIQELQSFCKQVSEQIEVPSFCKMLALSE